MNTIYLSLVLCTLYIAVWLRPWRCVGEEGPPWPWLLLAVSMPLMWGLDCMAKLPPVMQPMSGAALLVMLAGWPLTVMTCAVALLLLILVGHIEWAEGLYRMIWLGLLPATMALAVGAALRRWLRGHLFVYILGRGYFGTLLTSLLAGSLALAVRPAPVGSGTFDLWLARMMVANAEACLTCMVIACMTMSRPQWLATYAERLYPVS